MDALIPRIVSVVACNIYDEVQRAICERRENDHMENTLKRITKFHIYASADVIKSTAACMMVLI